MRDAVRCGDNRLIAIGDVDVLFARRITRRRAGAVIVASGFTRRGFMQSSLLAAANMMDGKSRLDLHESDSIKFEVSPGGHLLINAQIAGQNLNALLDTGAGSNAVDTDTARTLGLRSFTRGVASGMTGEVSVERVLLPSLLIGTRELPAASASRVDLSPFSLSSGRRIDVVLGRPFFENVRVEIDFPALELRITSLSAPEPAHESQLALKIDAHGRLTVPVMLDELGAVQAMHDLGSGIPLYVSPQYAEEHRLLEHKKVSQSATVGVEGLEFSKISTLGSISIAGFMVRNIPFQVPRAWNQESQVVVGLPVWSRFRNLIDLRAKKLGLTPEHSLADAPFARDRSGIGAQRLNDRLRILFISPGSPAEAAGLLAGDEIVRIDGEPVGPALYQRRPRPGAEPVGTVEELSLVSGRQVTIKLEDYF